MFSETGPIADLPDFAIRYITKARILPKIPPSCAPAFISAEGKKNKGKDPKKRLGTWDSMGFQPLRANGPGGIVRAPG